MFHAYLLLFIWTSSESVLSERPEICLLPPSDDDCGDIQQNRWYFDDESGACRQFLYQGCSGAGNSFETEQECLKICVFTQGEERDLVPGNTDPSISPLNPVDPTPGEVEITSASPETRNMEENSTSNDVIDNEEAQLTTEEMRETPVGKEEPEAIEKEMATMVDDSSTRESVPSTLLENQEIEDQSLTTSEAMPEPTGTSSSVPGYTDTSEEASSFTSLNIFVKGDGNTDTDDSGVSLEKEIEAQSSEGVGKDEDEFKGLEEMENGEELHPGNMGSAAKELEDGFAGSDGDSEHPMVTSGSGGAGMVIGGEGYSIEPEQNTGLDLSDSKDDDQKDNEQKDSDQMDNVNRDSDQKKSKEFIAGKELQDEEISRNSKVRQNWTGSTLPVANQLTPEVIKTSMASTLPVETRTPRSVNPTSEDKTTIGKFSEVKTGPSTKPMKRETINVKQLNAEMLKSMGAELKSSGTTPLVNIMPQLLPEEKSATLDKEIQSSTDDGNKLQSGIHSRPITPVHRAPETALKVSMETERTGTSPLRQENSRQDVYRPDFCSLHQVRGHCAGAVLRWYYDALNGSCHLFAYSGCGGNENNFENPVVCMMTCSDGGVKEGLGSVGGFHDNEGTRGTPSRPVRYDRFSFFPNFFFDRIGSLPHQLFIPRPPLTQLRHPDDVIVTQRTMHDEKSKPKEVLGKLGYRSGKALERGVVSDPNIEPLKRVDTEKLKSKGFPVSINRRGQSSPRIPDSLFRGAKRTSTNQNQRELGSTSRNTEVTQANRKRDLKLKGDPRSQSPAIGFQFPKPGFPVPAGPFPRSFPDRIKNIRWMEQAILLSHFPPPRLGLPVHFPLPGDKMENDEGINWRNLENRKDSSTGVSQGGAMVLKRNSVVLETHQSPGSGREQMLTEERRLEKPRKSRMDDSWMKSRSSDVGPLSGNRDQGTGKLEEEAGLSRRVEERAFQMVPILPRSGMAEVRRRSPYGLNFDDPRRLRPRNRFGQRIGQEQEKERLGPSMRGREPDRHRFTFLQIFVNRDQGPVVEPRPENPLPNPGWTLPRDAGEIRDPFPLPQPPRERWMEGPPEMKPREEKTLPQKPSIPIEHIEEVRDKHSSAHASGVKHLRQPTICKLPLDPGLCSLNQVKWYFDQQGMTCEMFNYGGCAGNENRFETRDDCLRTCTEEKDERSSSDIEGNPLPPQPEVTNGDPDDHPLESPEEDVYIFTSPVYGVGDGVKNDKVKVKGEDKVTLPRTITKSPSSDDAEQNEKTRSKDGRLPTTKESGKSEDAATVPDAGDGETEERVMSATLTFSTQYIVIVAGLGVVGLVVFIMIIVSIGRLCRKSKKSKKEQCIQEMVKAHMYGDLPQSIYGESPTIVALPEKEKSETK